MKTLLLTTAAAALLQLASNASAPVTATPEHFRYQRAVDTAGTAGPACAVLDTAVFAHSSSRSTEDVRLYAQSSTSSALTEVPYALTENGSQPSEGERATVRNLGTQGDRIVFDLVMPSRPYSEIDLGIDAQNFIATAELSGSNGTAPPTTLGTFTLYDLTAQHLARSTAMLAQESTFPVLHVALRFAHPDGKPLALAPSVITGADVPPSRLAQTLYTTVAETTALHTATSSTGTELSADFNIPPHIPIERASVVLNPAFTANFIRILTLTAKPHDEGDAHNVEHVEGEISREVLAVPGMPGAPPIHQQHLSLDAVLAANMRGPAAATVTVLNGNDKPLPVRAVRLEMRQRRICFDGAPATRYTLMYGDPALHAPIYDYARLFNASATAATATLSPETQNAHYTPRADTRPYTERHPELLWIVMLAVVAILGATAIGSAKHHRRSSH